MNVCLSDMTSPIASRFTCLSSIINWLRLKKTLGGQIPTPYFRYGKDLALMASLLFGVHPVHCEPVNSIVGRADLLFSAIFLFSSIIALRLHPQRKEMQI